MLRDIKPKNARSARALAKKAPLINENPKKLLFLKSTTSSLLVNSLVTDLFSLKRPLAARFQKKNQIYPFEDASSLEFFSEKNDTSLLCFSSNSKKRPHCITFVRCFDGKVLNMIEYTISPNSARTIAQFPGPKIHVGVKPLLSFSGLAFDGSSSVGTDYSRFKLAKSMFIDIFRGEEATEVDVEGLQMMYSFVAIEEPSEDPMIGGVIRMRVWRIITRRSNMRLPRIEVEEIGPRIDFRIGRVHNADENAQREALRSSRGIPAKSKKNVETEMTGNKTGRLHLGRQDLAAFQTRKLKGLKRNRSGSQSNDDEFVGDTNSKDQTRADHEVTFDDESTYENTLDSEFGATNFPNLKRPRVK